MPISERIRERRLLEGLSQKQLATQIGVTQATISQWESGDYVPERAKMAMLSTALSVTPMWLEFGGPLDDGPKTTPTSGIGEPIQAVPIIRWEEAVDVALDDQNIFAARPRKHVAAISEKTTLLALRIQTAECNLEFPIGTTIIVDYADNRLVDGLFYLFAHAGEAILRRWRIDPRRLEPFSSDPNTEPVFLKRNPEVIGRVLLATRRY
jgi:transcriptional regulator with XRE-family HTH domain